MKLATALARGSRGILALLVIAAAVIALPRSAEGQGVTTGAVRGRVVDASGQPVAGATVMLINSQTGARVSGTTTASGSYYVANVVVGVYTVEGRAIGYRPMRVQNLVVSLGQVADVDLRLEGAAVELEAIQVSGQTESNLLSTGRTGPSGYISEELIQNLPSLTRNFTDFTQTNVLVNGRSIAGSLDRFNNLQVDGGSNNDLFGLNATRGSPGGRNDSRPLTVEAVREYQVLIAPYDVRHSGFTGGLINAVTRSGTNQLRGSVFGFVQDDALLGDDTAGVGAAEFDRRFYGFSLGGPIVRDRFHFFVAAEWRHDQQPFQVRNISDTDTNNLGWTRGVGLSWRTAERIRQFASDSLGFDPGDWRQPVIPNPDRNLFFKLTGQLGQRSQLELSFNHVQSSQLNIVHDPFGANPTRLREGYQLNNSGYDNSSRNNSFRARLNTQLSARLTNEFMVSFQRIEDVREMRNRVSLVIIGADSAGAHFAIGGERFSHVNTLDQDILEITNNLTIAAGNHVFTVGARAERFAFVNGFFPASLGAWYFADTTSFFQRNPRRYERALPGYYADTLNGRRDGPIADFTFQQFGLYAQDQWTVARGLTLTLGLRADMTRMPQPAYNPLLDTAIVTVGPRAGQRFGVRTDVRPTDAVLLSPRVGFNYDVEGDRSLVLRGGIGIFSGRTPYVWASNAYTNTGLEQVQLVCDGPVSTTGGLLDTVPVFTVDPAAQATACRGPASPLSAPRPAVVYFDPDFKLPQNLRVSFGVDRRLPWNMVGSVDVLYTRAINQFLLEDVNLVEGGYSMGEGGRRLYGTLSTTSGSSTPRRATARANDVLRQFNSNQDYSYSIAFQLNKRLSDNVELSAGYAYSRSYDLMSATSDISNSLLNFATLDGTFRERNLTPSLFDTPHSIRFSGTAMLPYGFRFSLFYTGRSGRPYAYRYNSDVNGDGFAGNDLFYVPANSQDISLTNPADWARLDAFIEGEECLREQRGRIMERGSCRNPWQSFVDARIARTFRTVRGQTVEFTVNVFNVLSFLGVGGINRVTSDFENIAILNRTGYSNGLSRGIYSLLLPERERISVFASRWKVELGARYAF